MRKSMLTKETTFTFPASFTGYKKPALNLCRNIVFTRLARIQYGAIEIHDGVKNFCIGEKKRDGLRATIKIHDPLFYASVVFAGSIGAGESYMRGEWTCDKLTNLIRIIIKNKETLVSLESGLARITALLYNILHAGRKNTIEGSRKNVSVHYDLGNDFYKVFLDETLAYSCGIFSSEQATLKDASLEKFDRICKKLRLTADDHLLEIGTGWGGFTLFAARHYGCRITTTTISKKQYDLAKQKISEAGLAGRIKLLFNDYRELQGHFDKLVSIEMIEAVGHHYYEEFFHCCSKLLKQGGLMLLQAITITDQYYEKHRKSVDFISRQIFPGSCIPSITALVSAATSATDMKMFHLEDITPHYERTLREWRQNFFKEIDVVRRQGFTDSFIRMWEFYLCYCEAGFAERYLGDVQIIFTKPGCRHAPIIPQL